MPHKLHATGTWWPAPCTIPLGINPNNRKPLGKKSLQEARKGTRLRVPKPSHRESGYRSAEGPSEGEAEATELPSFPSLKFAVVHARQSLPAPREGHTFTCAEN